MKTQSLIVLSLLLFGCADPYKVPAGRIGSLPHTDPPPLIKYDESPNDTLADGAPVDLKIMLKAIEVKSSGQWFTLAGLEEKARAILTQKLT